MFIARYNYCQLPVQAGVVLCDYLTPFSWFLEYLSNGNITITEEEELPLISFEEPDLLDPSASSQPPHASIKEHSRELFRKRLKLLLVKGLFFGLGAVLFAAGCILVVTFRHGDVDEICTLDDEHTANVTVTASVLPSSVVFNSTLPSPTSTLTDHFRTLGDFTSSIFWFSNECSFVIGSHYLSKGLEPTHNNYYYYYYVTLFFYLFFQENMKACSTCIKF